MLKQLRNKPFKSLCYGIGLSASALMLSACGGSDSPAAKQDEVIVPAGPVISVSQASVVEGALGSTAQLIFTLTLAEASDQATSVDYTTQDVTATSGEDYSAASGTLNFTAGETTATVTVDVIGDDTFEVDEYFALVLSNAQGLELDISSIGKGTIATDEDADSEGYFFGSATMGSTEVSDLIGLAYENRLMLFSKTGNPNVLYDIKGMVVDRTSYTATADVYVDGEIVSSLVSVSGETTETSISGTMDGEGFAKVSFEVAFIEEANQQAATWERIETTAHFSWANEGHKERESEGIYFGVYGDRTYSGATYDLFSSCAFEARLGYSETINIYVLQHDIYAAVGVCETANTGHTGFVSVITDGVENDTLVYAFANGTLSQFVTLTRY